MQGVSTGHEHLTEMICSFSESVSLCGRKRKLLLSFHNKVIFFSWKQRLSFLELVHVVRTQFLGLSLGHPSNLSMESKYHFPHPQLKK